MSTANEHRPCSVAPAAAAKSLHSCDLEETRAKVALMFKPHRMQISARAAKPFSAHITHRPAQRCSINELGYGSAVDIDPGRMETFYLALLPLRGSASIEAGNERFEVREGVGALITPQAPVRMRWGDDCAMRVIKFDPGVIDDAAAAITGMPGEAGAATLPRIELSSSAGRSFLGLFSEFRQALLDPEHLIHRPALGRQMEAVLCTALLLAQSPLEGRAQTVHVPAYVRRAREYLHDHVGEAVTAADLATHVRVGARTLFAAFSAIYGASPMAYLRELRLRAVHEELLARADDPSATVTDIGLRWGVTHQSRFAATYRLRYGRLPSHELRAVAGASNRRS